jgi:hypothetical protein
MNIAIKKAQGLQSLGFFLNGVFSRWGEMADQRPYHRSLFCMGADVSRDAHLMLTVCDRFGFASHGPDAAFGKQTALAQGSRTFFFGDAHEVAWGTDAGNGAIGGDTGDGHAVGVSGSGDGQKSGENVVMPRRDAEIDEIDTMESQSAGHHLASDMALRAGEDDARAALQAFGAFERGGMGTDGRRIFVVTFDMFAVVAGTPAALVTRKPRGVGVAHNMKPVVPRLFCGSFHGRNFAAWNIILQEKKPRDCNPWAFFLQTLIYFVLLSIARFALPLSP